MSGPPPGTPVGRITVAGLLALSALEVLWETVLAPSGRGWLALKALPLAILLPGTMRGARKPRQWLALLLPFYAAEGVVRLWSESGRSAVVAGAITLLAVGTFVALLAWLRRK